jgi:hypothetical protein
MLAPRQVLSSLLSRFELELCGMVLVIHESHFFNKNRMKNQKKKKIQKSNGITGAKRSYRKSQLLHHGLSFSVKVSDIRNVPLDQEVVEASLRDLFIRALNLYRSGTIKMETTSKLI